ncbi:MAG: CofH family radical SAM protein, partial [Desulfuromonadales bacterium]|nr:CofH family radical SAM protein [Desulfuromonadales bacterium]
MTDPLQTIKNKINANTPLDHDEALWLLREADLLTLGQLADAIRARKHPQQRVTFVIDRNVNYTNVCTSKCKFCAFYRNPDDADSYLLNYDTIMEKVQGLVEHGGTQLLMQGGLHPELRIEWFEELFRQIRQRFPQVQIHSLSPAEVIHIAKQSGLSMAECLGRLKTAGLASVPGGGAEVLVDAVRLAISPNKIGTRDWLAVMEEAHRLNMSTTATMMFGSSEAPQDIVEHLFVIRDLQEKTGGFTAFIPWTYQPGNTELGGETASGVAYLRVLALSR